MWRSSQNTPGVTIETIDTPKNMARYDQKQVETPVLTQVATASVEEA